MRRGFAEFVGTFTLIFIGAGSIVAAAAAHEGQGGAGLVTMQWVDESGNTSPVLPVPGNYLSPALSADGNRLAFTLGGDVWVYDLKHPGMVRLTFGGGLYFDEFSASGHYYIHVHLGARVFIVSQIKQCNAVDQANTGCRNRIIQR